MIGDVYRINFGADSAVRTNSSAWGLSLLVLVRSGMTTELFEYRYNTADRLDQLKKDSVVVSEYDFDAKGNRIASFRSGQSPIERERYFQPPISRRGIRGTVRNNSRAYNLAMRRMSTPWKWDSPSGR